MKVDTAAVISGYLNAQKPRLVEDLEEFVVQETPSDQPALLNSFTSFLSAYITNAFPCDVEELPFGDGSVDLRVTVPGKGTPLLLLAHFDTVWPKGTLNAMPFKIANGVASGPGVFDMKAGLVQGLWAIRALAEAQISHPPLILLCTCDEEIGSPKSRTLIETEARKAAAVLVLEPALDGKLKTARKGVGVLKISVIGRASHAGLDPGGGINAIDELARLLLECNTFAAPGKGTTLNVGTISGGTRANVVPAAAAAEIDVRVETDREAARVMRMIRQLVPGHAEARFTVEGGLRWPPMERTAGAAGLFARARELGRELGLDLEETSVVGGASDGNFCAAVGADVLDGLGAVGGGAHAHSEHVMCDQMPLRAALVARLIQSFSIEGGGSQ